MPTIQLNAELTTDQLLSAAGQLDEAELDVFVRGVLNLRARRISPYIDSTQESLLQRINQSLSESDQARYDELIVRRDAKSLTPTEHEELIRLSDLIEQLQADRAAALVELARNRRMALDSLLADLGIPAPGHV